MSNLKTTCKATLMAASLTMAFGTAYAGQEPAPMHVAQAKTDQGGTAGSPSASSGSSAQGGTSSQGGSGKPDVFVHPPIAVPVEPATSGQSGTTGQSGTSAQSGTTGQSSTSAQSGTSGASGQPGQIKVAPPIYVIMPPATAASDSTMKQGCWVKIYDRENFAGDSLTLTGPIALSDMSGPYGLNWDDKVNSLETGPKASVSVFDNPGYTDPVAQFKPGQRIPDISKRTGLFDEFASLKVDCQKG